VRYGFSSRFNNVQVSMPYNFAPLFWEDGRLHARMRARERGESHIVLEWDDESGRDGFLYRIKRTSLLLLVALRGRVNADLSRVALTPIPGGVRVDFGAGPDPGPEPRLTPIFFKRIRLRRPRYIPADDREKRSTFYVYTLRQGVAHIVSRYTAASHVGGQLFLLNNDPLPLRRPFLDVVTKKFREGASTAAHVYIKVRSIVLTLSGLGGRTYGCVDLIEDVDGKHYIRLVEHSICARG